jgi:phosphohistidine phosphatase
VAHRLLLIRHAKAEQPTGGQSDHDRPLALQGRSDAREVAAVLAEAGLSPDLAIVSSAVRTQQTWSLMAAVLDDADAVTEPAIYSSSVESLVEVVASTDESVGTVAVVGHEPTVSGAAAWLASEGSVTAALQRVAQGLPTGTVAVLEYDGTWAELGARSARLVAVKSPSRREF